MATSQNRPKFAQQHAAGWPLKRKSAGRNPLPFITALHRGGDSYVTFHRKPDDHHFLNLFSIRASHLNNVLPQHLDYLREDAFFSINGFWNPALTRERPVPFITGVYSRKVTRLRYLNSIYSDIDCYTKHVDRRTAWTSIGRLIKKGALPPPSMGLVSRGLWLFWLLRDGEQDDTPPRSYSKNLRAYREITDKIYGVLEGIGADHGARDAARTTRIPGSINSKDNRVVQVLWPAGQTPITYTLSELVRFFRVELPSDIRDWRFYKRVEEAMIRRGIKPPRTAPAGVNGWTRVNWQRLQQFLALQEIRQGFSEGCRNRAAFIYARLLTTCVTSRGLVKKKVEQLGRNCHPPLTPSEINGAVRSGTAKRETIISNRTIRDWLKITWEEHIALKTKFGRYAWKPAPGQPVPPSRFKIRREAIQRIVRKHNGWLPIRPMATLLEKKGHAVSPTQVAKDYRVLGLHAPARTRGRR